MSVTDPLKHNLSVGTQHSGNGGSVALQGSTLSYFASSNDYNLKVITFNASGLQSRDLGSVTDDYRWANTHLSDVIASANGAKLKAKLGTAAAVLNGTSYFFWVDGTTTDEDERKPIYAAIRSPDGTLGSVAVRVYSGDDAYVGASALAASVTPDGKRIVLLRYGRGTTNIYSLVLDPAALDLMAGQWKGTQGRTLTLSSYDSNATGDYFQISAAWYPQGGSNWMLASFYSSEDHTVRFLNYRIQDDGTPVSHSSSDVVKVQAMTGVRAGCSLTRDPAGRILAVYCDGNRYIGMSPFDTNRDPTGAPFAWADPVAPFGGTDKTDVMAVPAFVAATPVEDQRVQGSQNGEELTLEGTTTMTQYGLLLYDDNLRVIAGTYGESVLVPRVSTQTPASSDSVTLAMVMDPFPFPNENLTPETTPLGSRLVTYIYGTSSEEEDTFGLKTQVQFGVKSEVHAFVATEAEFRAGPMAQYSHADIVKSATGFEVYTAPTEGDDGLEIAKLGALFVTSLPMVVEDASVFIGTDGVIPNGDDAPLFSAIRPVSDIATHRSALVYEPYTSTPGALETYTAASIDANMAERYSRLPPDQRQILDEAGFSTNYMEDVVRPNAISFGDHNFLEIPVGAVGAAMPTYEHIDSETGLAGLVVDGSLYVGESTDTTLSLVVVAEEGTQKFLAGVDFSFEITTETTRTNSWGISFKNDMPLPPAGGHSSYTVLMYVLPPNRLWTLELQYLSGAGSISGAENADPQSAPTKIMFEVISHD
ncbi:MAG: hypothetical protein AAGI52_13135 [Bacteroidota bacterium]